MIRTALVLSLIFLAACQKQPAQTGQADPGPAPAAAGASPEAAAASSTPSKPPDLSGEPIKGSVPMAEGAATTDPNAPRPAPK